MFFLPNSTAGRLGLAVVVTLALFECAMAPGVDCGYRVANMDDTAGCDQMRTFGDYFLLVCDCGKFLVDKVGTMFSHVTSDNLVYRNEGGEYCNYVCGLNLP